MAISEGPRLLDDNLKRAMGNVYEDKDMEKDQIQNNFDKRKTDMREFGKSLMNNGSCSCISLYMQLVITLT